jgi:hypothetical protein
MFASHRHLKDSKKYAVLIAYSTVKLEKKGLFLSMNFLTGKTCLELADEFSKHEIHLSLVVPRKSCHSLKTIFYRVCSF